MISKTLATSSCFPYFLPLFLVITDFWLYSINKRASAMSAFDISFENLSLACIKLQLL